MTYSNEFFVVLRKNDDYMLSEIIFSNFSLCSSDGSKRSLPFLKEESHSEELSISYQTETHLVSLLNQLCSRLMEKDNAKLLDVFFHASQNLSSNDDTILAGKTLYCSITQEIKLFF